MLGKPIPNEVLILLVSISCYTNELLRERVDRRLYCSSDYPKVLTTTTKATPKGLQNLMTLRMINTIDYPQNLQYAAVREVSQKHIKLIQRLLEYMTSFSTLRFS